MEPDTRYARVTEDYKSPVLLIKLIWHIMRWHNPSPQGGNNYTVPILFPGVPQAFTAQILLRPGWWDHYCLRRSRIRFIGNGRLVRNAVDSRYYLTSLSASYLTTIGTCGEIRTLNPSRHSGLNRMCIPIPPRRHICGPRSAKEPYFFLL